MSGPETVEEMKLNNAIYTLKLCYRKHHFEDVTIGWDELADMLCDTLCELMGDKEFQQWNLEWERNE
jgi:hypothetical protein